MQTDRTTRFLLAAIAAGLWVNLLVPLFAPRPAAAQYRLRDLVTDVNIVRVGGLNVNGNAGLPVFGGVPGSRPVAVTATSPASAGSRTAAN